jgi:hypothetical protein
MSTKLRHCVFGKKKHFKIRGKVLGFLLKESPRLESKQLSQTETQAVIDLFLDVNRLRSLFDRDLNENDQSKLQASRISNKIS